MNIEETIRSYLPGVVHLSLATCLDNKPWVCEVHFAYDEELNLYFCSTAQRRHSKEIQLNPNVAGNIVEQHQLGQKPRGIYFEGIAELLNDVSEDDAAYKAYNGRFGRGDELLEDAKEEDGHKFYKITVSTFYMFDSRESSPSKKYELPWKKVSD